MLGRQRGVAVITALLLTTLAVTIVASLFWQQQVQVRSMENQRLHLQTKWILRGALDWARLILRQDGLDNRETTALTGVWAMPLAETRLDQYIERERVEGESFDATLSGHIIDAQSRYNLANLASNRAPNDAQVATFRRLLVNLQLDPGLAEPAALAVAKTQAVPTPAPAPAGSSEPVALMQLDDLLSVPGYTQEAVARLREFAVVLPEQTTVNVNTAPAEVLAAVVEGGFSVSDAAAIVARRKQARKAYFGDKAAFVAELNGKTVASGAIDVKSEYFLVMSRVRLDRAALDAEVLINRKLGGAVATSLVWVRQN